MLTIDPWKTKNGGQLTSATVIDCPDTPSSTRNLYALLDPAQRFDHSALMPSFLISAASVLYCARISSAKACGDALGVTLPPVLAA